MNLHALPLWANLLVLAAGSAVVWSAGARLSRHVDRIAERTGLGTAFLGALLLGGVTSLPEIATTLTASFAGNAPLAVNNILGGVAMQVAILAIADAAAGGPALSAVLNASAILLQGVLLMFVLAVTAAGIVVGGAYVLGFDLWTAAILGGAILGLLLIRRYEAHPRWLPDGGSGEAPSQLVPAARVPASELSNRRLAAQTVLVSLLILAAGAAVASAGDALAVQTGLGASFVGAILVAIATSLPEVSTTVEAARLGRHGMAFGNIFGTNLFDLGLLFLADLAYSGGAVLDEVGDFSLFGALLGAALTSVYLAGILLRRVRTIARMGVDSILVVLLYLGGVAILYTLR